MSDRFHGEIEGRVPPSTSALIVHVIAIGLDVLQKSILLVLSIVRELCPEDGEDAFAGRSPCIADRAGGGGVVGGSAMAGGTSAVVLNRLGIFVVLVQTMTFATGRLHGTVEGSGRNIVAMCAVTIEGPGGGVMGAGLVAVRADAWVAGTLVTDAAVTADVD